jgi:N-glycosidase YbiA
MFEEHQTELLLPGGARHRAVLEVYMPDEGNDPYEVGLDLNGEWLVGRSRRGVFFALQELRRHLDQIGVLIDCEGASENVYPSGMIEDMGPCVKGYRLRLGSQTALSDLVDIFERSPLTKPSTVEAQKLFFGDWCSYFDGQPKVIPFYKVSDDYGFMSNFSPHPIELDGKTWPTSEHYFQAQKFTDDSYREVIRGQSTAISAAKLGRSREHPIRSDWEAAKDDVMHRAVAAKFAQHKDLRDLLLRTGRHVLVERTENDAYWGDGGDGSGRNMLGQILMRVRDDLRSR